MISDRFCAVLTITFHLSLFTYSECNFLNINSSDTTKKFMIIYEITAVVRADLIEQYEKYMSERHIPDLLETGFFSRAYFTRSGENRYRVQYHAHDRAALDEYLKTGAEDLRNDFLEHFPEGIEVSRENWEILQTWQNE